MNNLREEFYDTFVMKGEPQMILLRDEVEELWQWIETQITKAKIERDAEIKKLIDEMIEKYGKQRILYIKDDEPELADNCCWKISALIELKEKLIKANLP